MNVLLCLDCGRPTGSRKLRCPECHIANRKTRNKVSNDRMRAAYLKDNPLRCSHCNQPFPERTNRRKMCDDCREARGPKYKRAFYLTSPAKYTPKVCEKRIHYTLEQHMDAIVQADCMDGYNPHNPEPFVKQVLETWK